jgi:Icc-related predicted phosphoesterase
MKILAIGDFHGRFPNKVNSIINKEKIDFALSVGDFFPWSMKNTFFKYCFTTDKNLWEVLGKEKYKKLTLKDLKEGDKKVLSKLNSLSVPVFTTIGNYDAAHINDQYYSKRWKTSWKWAEQDFLSTLLKKYPNIKRADYSFVKFKDYIIIGGYGHSSPGSVKSKAYKDHKRKLDKLFNKFKRENKEKKVIFIFHNMPYNTKLDKITSKKADKSVRNKHFGSKMTRKIIDKYQPILGIGGHMHENTGTCKIGKTIVLNPGAAVDNRFAVIDIDEANKKIKRIKFFK